MFAMRKFQYFILAFALVVSLASIFEASGLSHVQADTGHTARKLSPICEGTPTYSFCRYSNCQRIVVPWCQDAWYLQLGRIAHYSNGDSYTDWGWNAVCGYSICTEPWCGTSTCIAP